MKEGLEAFTGDKYERMGMHLGAVGEEDLLKLMEMYGVDALEKVHESEGEIEEDVCEYSGMREVYMGAGGIGGFGLKKV